MGKIQKSTNTSQLEHSTKRAQISDTDSETSSEDGNEIPILNISQKIKTEPQYSSADSECDSENDKNAVSTQKLPAENCNRSSSSSEDDNKVDKSDVKQEVEETSEHSESNTEENLFKTNKYLTSQSKFGTKRNQFQSVSNVSDESSSSSSEQDTLRGAFLGKVRSKSRKTKSTKSVQSNKAVTLSKNVESSSSDELSDNQKYQNKTTPTLSEKIAKVKDKSKLVSPEVNKKVITKIVKQKKPRKSDTSLTENNKSQDFVQKSLNNTLPSKKN